MPQPHEMLHLQTQSAEPNACLEHEAYEEHEENLQHQHLHKTPLSTSDMAQHKIMPPDDMMASEDSWVAWDGPVWCSRFGRFENQEDAAHDDGYPKDPRSPIYQDRRLHRCEKSTWRPSPLPVQHHSYVKDIKRRLEPMAHTLIQLEHQMQQLIQSAMKDGETFYRTGSFHNDGKNGGAIAVHHGELGDSVHTPIRDHNHTGEIFAPDVTPSIGLEAPSVETVQQSKPRPAAVDDSTSSNHGNAQELSSPKYAHHTEGSTKTVPPPERIEKFKADYNQEWPHYECVRKEHVEPMEETIRKLEGKAESLLRQIRLMTGSEHGVREENGSHGNESRLGE